MMRLHTRSVWNDKLRLVVSAMSLELAIISTLAGVALGLRYKVMILIPVAALVMMFAMIVGLARGDHFWSIFSATVISGTAIQLGYLAGISIRAAVVILVLDAQAGQRHRGG
jgi:hypothetical protein